VNTTGSRLYVTNYGSNTVSVIDTATYKLIDTNPTTTAVDSITVGRNPRGIAFVQTAAGGLVYVVNRTSCTVSVINADTNKLIDTNPATTKVDAIKVGSTPQQIAISPDKKFAYVTNYGSTSVSVINLATNKVDATIAVASTPIGVAVSPDSSTVYVANGNDRISVIDTKSRTVIATWQIDPAPETNFHILALRADGALPVTDFAEKNPARGGLPTWQHRTSSGCSDCGVAERDHRCRQRFVEFQRLRRGFTQLHRHRRAGQWQRLHHPGWRLHLHPHPERPPTSRPNTGTRFCDLHGPGERRPGDGDCHTGGEGHSSHPRCCGRGQGAWYATGGRCHAKRESGATGHLRSIRGDRPEVSRSVDRFGPGRAGQSRGRLPPGRRDGHRGGSR
jgi:YVTN family beta-propeller protein